MAGSATLPQEETPTNGGGADFSSRHDAMKAAEAAALLIQIDSVK